VILSLLFFKLGDELVFHEEEIEVEKQLVPETPKRKWAGPGHSKGGGWSPGTKVHAP
jgi:hypothetical protein